MKRIALWGDNTTVADHMSVFARTGWTNLVHALLLLMQHLNFL